MDVTPLVQTEAGTARYIRALLRELRDRDDVKVHCHAFGGRARIWNLPRDALWYPFALSREARRLPVLHCPTYRGPIAGRTPLVVTAHDLAVFRHPETFNRWSRIYGPVAIPRVLRTARLVIAVSEFTKRELVDVLGVSVEKIRVVRNGIEEGFTFAGEAAAGDYVLAIGTVEPRKNLVRTAEATRRLGVELRVVGAPGWGRVDLTGNGVRWLGRVPDEELAALYRGARVVAYASLYEGFGIPLLEAMACGVPVVTSRGGATEEIANGAAILVDPLDVSDIAAGIERADSHRSELIARGLEHASTFRWRNAADATVAVYREATG
jgi:glycosyltransferase involved in cell wall biosynthesis